MMTCIKSGHDRRVADLPCVVCEKEDLWRRLRDAEGQLIDILSLCGRQVSSVEPDVVEVVRNKINEVAAQLPETEES